MYHPQLLPFTSYNLPNPNQRQTAARNSTYIPHLKRMTDADPTLNLVYYPHHMLPKCTQIRTEHPPAVDFQLSHYTAAHPLPVGRTTQRASGRIDPVGRLPHEKAAHLTRLHQLRNRYDNFQHERRYKKAMRDLIDRPHVQLNAVRQYAEELTRDPDAHFTGPYDWYRTGSTLALVPGEPDDWLVHVVDVHGGQLNGLSRFPTTNHQPTTIC